MEGSASGHILISISRAPLSLSHAVLCVFGVFGASSGLFCTGIVHLCVFCVVFSRLCFLCSFF